MPSIKVATTADKLNIIPHLPKGKKPILKRRTLAEVLVRGLSKAAAPHTIPDPDETCEIDLIQAPLPKGASLDRLTLLRTTSDTNLLQPAGLSLTADEGTSGQHAKSAFRQPRSRVHSSSHFDNTPGSSRSTGERHISFNTFVTQCIAIQPGEHVPEVFDEEDEADRPAGYWEEALSIASSESHPRLSRSNSHSSDLSERLTIAPMPPTMLKLRDEGPEDDDGGFMMGGGKKAAKENGHGRRAREGPVLVYAPPTGSDSVYAPRDVNHPSIVEADAAIFDYFDSGERTRHHHRYRSRHELLNGEITVGGHAPKHALSNSSQGHNIDNRGVGGQVLHSTGEHQMKDRILDQDHLLGHPAAEKAGINTSASVSISSTSAVYGSISGTSSTSTLHQAQQEHALKEPESEASIGRATTPSIPIPRSPRPPSPTPILDTSYSIDATDERRGRTLARTSSASSLNERVKNNAGNIGVSVGSIGGSGCSGSGSGVDMSPAGSLSPESSRASSSRGSSAGTGMGRGRGVSKLDTSSSREHISSGLSATNETAKPAPPTPPSPTRLVDKAKGILGTLLGHTAAAVVPATNTTAVPQPPSPHHSEF